MKQETNSKLSRSKLVNLIAKILKNKLGNDIKVGLTPEVVDRSLIVVRYFSLTPRSGSPFCGEKFNKLKKSAMTSKKHYDVLNSLSAEWLKFDLATPKPIKEWVIQVLSGEVQRPKVPGRKSNYMLKRHLAQAVYTLKSHYDIHPNKNNASGHDMFGFSIVADAAQKIGLKHVTSNTVRHAYDRDFSSLKC